MTVHNHIPNAGYRAWSVECCRTCDAWLPSLDLRLAPATNDNAPDREAGPHHAASLINMLFASTKRRERV